MGFEPKKDEIKKFIEFELSAAGQKIVMDEGFFAINKEQQKANADAFNKK